MAGSLLIRTPRGGHFEVRLGQTRTLGRGWSQDIELPDKQVSRRHGAIAWANGHFWLQDRSSKNGTYLNGVRVIAPTRLCDGDIIEMGETQMIFSDDCQRGYLLTESNEVPMPPTPHLEDSLSARELPSGYDHSSSGSANQ